MKSGSIANTDSLAAGRTSGQSVGDGRTSGGVQSPPPGTNGAPAGTSGSAFLIAWTCAVALAAMIISLNILSRRQQAPQEVLAAPLIDELSSLVTLAPAYLVPGGLVVWIRSTRPHPMIAAAVLIAGLTGFVVMHLGGCAILRAQIYPAILGEAYGFGGLTRELPFEFAKDLLAYLAVLAGFHLILSWRSGGAAAVAPMARAEARATFDIQDGTRLIRAPVGDILAVRSAGNYAEFLLADGRRPLMRAALSALQGRLEPEGFVRTHRSWLVNSARVTGLRPEGSGDYAVELGEIEAPLSRRFREASASLRR